MLSIKHATRQINKEQKQESVSITWQGTKPEVEAYLATLTLGNWYDGLGQFTSSRISQEAGPIWLLELFYVVTYDDNGEIANDDDEVSGPNTQTLQAHTMSMPLETAPGYLTRWNHFLVGKYWVDTQNVVHDYTTVVPAWWATATNTYMAPTDAVHYMWVKSLDSVPVPETDEDGNVKSYWCVVKDPNNNVACKPVKVGVETYDKAFYVITEVGEHRSKTKAGWATAELINTVVRSPLLGDFGVTPSGYDWKVDSIDIAYDGRRWRASRTYTRSGDALGWDPDLYAYNYTP